MEIVNIGILRHSTKRIAVVLISIVSAMGLQCSMQLTTQVLSDEEQAYGRLHKAVLYVIRSLPENRLISLLLTLVIFGLLVCATSYVRHERRLLIYSGTFSLVFAITQLFAMAFDYANDPTPITENIIAIVRAFFIVVAYCVPTYCCVAMIMTWLSDHGGTQIYANYDVRPTAKMVLKTAGIIFLCWLPYLIIFYPGVSNWDVASEIMQFFHERNDFILSLSVAHGDMDAYATNMHPWFDTLVFGAFVKIGIMIGGSASLGAAIYSIFQMMSFSVLFAYIWSWFKCAFENRGGQSIDLLADSLFGVMPTICYVFD